MRSFIKLALDEKIKVTIQLPPSAINEFIGWPNFSRHFVLTVVTIIALLAIAFIAGSQANAMAKLDWKVTTQ